MRKIAVIAENCGNCGIIGDRNSPSLSNDTNNHDNACTHAIYICSKNTFGKIERMQFELLCLTGKKSRPQHTSAYWPGEGWVTFLKKKTVSHSEKNEFFEGILHEPWTNPFWGGGFAAWLSWGIVPCLNVGKNETSALACQNFLTGDSQFGVFFWMPGKTMKPGRSLKVTVNGKNPIP